MVKFLINQDFSGLAFFNMSSFSNNKFLAISKTSDSDIALPVRAGLHRTVCSKSDN